MADSITNKYALIAYDLTKEDIMPVWVIWAYLIIGFGLMVTAIGWREWKKNND
jgi:hypothetical protein